MKNVIMAFLCGRAQAAPGHPIITRCRNVRDVLSRGYTPGGNIETFLHLDGLDNRTVVLDANAIPVNVRALAEPQGE